MLSMNTVLRGIFSKYFKNYYFLNALKYMDF